MKNKKIILFQGDSITDACRERERNVYLGSGYPNFIAGILECKYPYEYEYINRGVSGNRITDMYARINKDAIKLSPDYLSILIGINDVWHEVDVQDGVDNEKFEKVYDLMLSEIKEKLPNTKLILMEPFVVKGIATNYNDEVWKYFDVETKKRAKVVRKMAKKYNATFIPLQDLFDSVSFEKENDSTYVRDGVHPTAAGSYLIAKRWIETFEKLEKLKNNIKM